MQIFAVPNSYASAPVNAPTSLSNVPSTTSVAISFTAPTNDGGSAITNYEYSFNNSSWTALSPVDAISPITVSGLSQNTGYSVYLRAVNIIGSGPASSATSFTTTRVPLSVEVLVVAGGGGGGGQFGGGGGGAGGFRNNAAFAVAFGTAYAINIGGGGALSSGTLTNGSNGASSSFSTYAASGGAGGGTVSGGSGGGGHGTGSSGGSGNAGSYSPVEGYAGGSGAGIIAGRSRAGGGGGGAGAVGNNNSGENGGGGGIGALSSINGASTYYAGGGGGGYYSDYGGSGGQGSGSTGAGGNGGWYYGPGGTGQNGTNGNSGIVTIAYPDTYPVATLTGLTYTQPTRAGYRVYQITASSSGTITFN